jgi:serine/threonine protein kinase
LLKSAPVLHCVRATSAAVCAASGATNPSLASARAWAAAAAIASNTHSAGSALRLIYATVTDVDLLPSSLFFRNRSRRENGRAEEAGVHVRPLGRGAFGLVTLAKDPDNSLFAIKHLDSAALAEAQQLHRAVRELRAHALVHASLRFPRPFATASAAREGGARFIAKILGASSSSNNKSLFILLEACQQANTLSILRKANAGKRRVEGTSGLPLPSVRAIAACLLAALAHLRSLRLVHRDVKPSNVCIGPDGLPRLIDFGFARTVDSSEAARDAAGFFDFVAASSEDNTAAPLSPATLAALASLPACCDCTECFGPGDMHSSAPHPSHVFHDAAASAVHAARVSLRLMSSRGDAAAETKIAAVPTAPASRRASVVGSVAHMAPEVADASADARGADVWSWAVTVYELATGMSPFSQVPAWAGEDDGDNDNMDDVDLPNATATSSRARMGAASALPLPSATRAAWPALDALLTLAFNADPRRRPTPMELISHAAFSGPLPGSSATFWERPIDPQALFDTGSVLPPVFFDDAGIAGADNTGSALIECEHDSISRQGAIGSDNLTSCAAAEFNSVG